MGLGNDKMYVPLKESLSKVNINSFIFNQSLSIIDCPVHRTYKTRVWVRFNRLLCINQLLRSEACSDGPLEAVELAHLEVT
jgi:hypothetical protein